LLYEQQ